MPRPSKGAHLLFRKREAVWYIRDGEVERSTGCGQAERSRAEEKLGEYLASKHEPDFGKGDPLRVLIADVLTHYAEKHAPHTKRPEIAAGAILHLVNFFEGMRVGEITPDVCRTYVAWRTAMPQASYRYGPGRRFETVDDVPRVGEASPRRELIVLSAAIGFAYGERKLRYIVPVKLPDKAPARDRWLSRDEAAALLHAARATPMGKGRHLARFILLALYTGTRHSAITKIKWLPTTEGGWIDLRAGMMYRRGSREGESTKRRTPVPLSKRLRGHLVRWRRDSSTHVVEFDGAPVRTVRKAFTSARIRAGLGPEVTPHILRHTFATWAVQAGAPLGLVAAALGTSEQIVETVYGHHAPERLRSVVETVSTRRR